MKRKSKRKLPFKAPVTAPSRVIYFSATWCQPCKAFGPRVEAVAKACGVAVTKVDVDDPPAEYKNVADWVRSVPHLRWVGDRPGAQTLVGAVSKEKLTEWMKAGVADAGRPE